MSEIRGAATEKTLRRVATLVGSEIDPINGEIRGAATEETLLRIEAAIRSGGESDGEVHGSIAELTAKGWAEQVQTTGKNLFHVNDLSVGSVTYTNTSDGILVIGTSRAIYQSDQRSMTSEELDMVKGKTLTLSCAEATDDLFIQVGFLDGQTTIWHRVKDENAKTFTVPQNLAGGYMSVIFSKADATVNIELHPQLELGSTATDYEPYTGGKPLPSPDYPQEIRVAKGRNLIAFDETTSGTYNGITFTFNPGPSVTADGTATQATGANSPHFMLDAGTYTLSGKPTSASKLNIYKVINGVISVIGSDMGSGLTFTLTEQTEVYIYPIFNSGTTVSNLTFYPQLELGSTPQPYVPYGYVGLEVRQSGTLLSTTPIPLPSRGWVGSLPDGTADKLTLDGAGKVTWELADDEVVLDGSNDETFGSTSISGVYAVKSIAAKAYSGVGKLVYSNKLISQAVALASMPDYSAKVSDYTYMAIPDATNEANLRTWLSTNPVTVLYPLATPVTEECGYCEDWPTDIPEGATVTIPELDEVDIRYFVDSAVTELARQWYERAYDELGDAVTELAERVTALENA